MKPITFDEIGWAKDVLDEIVNSTDNWWRPMTNSHQIFEQARMKFVNRNLNYFSFENMLLSMLEGYEFNPQLPKTLEFCEYARILTGDRGPYGRMCVWQILPHAELLPHKDVYKYHSVIIRNIFILSKHNINNSQIEIQGKIVNHDQGTLFQFKPDVELHSFKNMSDEPWYFLGYDYWIPELLFESLNTVDLTEIYNDPIRQQSESVFGWGSHKFMSEH